MKRTIMVGIVVIGVGLTAVGGYTQEPKKEEKVVTLKSILLEQLRSTHNEKDYTSDRLFIFDGCRGAGMRRKA